MIVIINWSDNRQVIRCDQLTLVQKILQDIINIRQLQSFDRMFWFPVIILDAKNDIAAAPVVEIIGKGCNCLQRRFRFPGFFKLDPRPFNYIA